MDADKLRSIPPFDSLPFVDEGDGSTLRQPVAGRFAPLPYVADGPEVVCDLLGDESLVPVGAVRAADGAVRAIFWQSRDRGAAT